MEVDAADLSVSSVRIEGAIRDTYDWDFQGPAVDRRAAQVQAGFGTLGSAGGVFKTEVVLEGLVEIEFDFGSTD